MSKNQSKTQPSSRAEQYARNPTLRNRSLLLAREIDALQNNPANKEFRKMLYKLKREIMRIGRLDKREKRKIVVEALKNHVCEIDELVEETRLKRAEIVRILKVLLRAKLIVPKWRPHFINPDGSHGARVYFWHESETIINH